MKHFKYIRKILIILEVLIAIALAIVLCFIPMDISVKAGLLIGVAVFFVIFYLLDHLHNRYLDDMLEELTFLIEELVGKQEVKVFFGIRGYLAFTIAAPTLKITFYSDNTK